MSSGSTHSQVSDTTTNALNGTYMDAVPFEYEGTTARRSPLPIWKRCIDLACCLVALPLLISVTLMFAALLSIASPGRIIFRQERVGYRGNRFRIYKFRTMHVNAGTTTHQNHFAELVRSNVPMQKMDSRGDARLVPGGWILRATGLDELPQIVNVLRGDMSIVGPRPCIPYEYEQYNSNQRKRFNAVPGITGLWQVSGKNRTTFERMVELDIKYSQKQSFWLDLSIIVRTPIVLIRQALGK
jgi:lipopolysaccharide/colanic/teichoic acid biosynthesis glycosyltransferase